MTLANSTTKQLSNLLVQAQLNSGIGQASERMIQ